MSNVVVNSFTGLVPTTSNLGVDQVGFNTRDGVVFFNNGSKIISAKIMPKRKYYGVTINSGQSYTNSTGYDVLITIIVNLTSGQISYAYTGGFAVSTIGHTSSGNMQGTHSFIVPDGGTASLGGSGTVTNAHIYSHSS